MGNFNTGQFMIGVAGNLLVISLLNTYSAKTAKLYVILLFFVLFILFYRQIFSSIAILNGTVQGVTNMKNKR